MDLDESQHALIARRRRRQSGTAAVVTLAVLGLVATLILIFDPPVRRVERPEQAISRVAGLFVAVTMIYTYVFIVLRKGYGRSWRASPLWMLPASSRRRLRARVRRGNPPGADRTLLMLTAEEMKQQAIMQIMVSAYCLLFVASTSMWISPSVGAVILVVAALCVWECGRLAWNARAGARYLANYGP